MKTSELKGPTDTELANNAVHGILYIKAADIGIKHGVLPAEVRLSIKALLHEVGHTTFDVET